MQPVIAKGFDGLDCYDRCLLGELLANVSAFDERIATREASIGIVGLGYAGLPLAMSFAEAGFDITGIDLNEDRVRAVEERRSYLVDVPEARYHGIEDRLHATSDYSAAADLDALTICVPTPLSKTRTPDLSFVVSAAESVAENLRPGQLVVLQSTTHPGTTEEMVQPILERTGAEVGTDFFLGYAPERVDPGNTGGYTIRNTPKLVAGVTPECLRRTELLYRQIVDVVVPTSSPMVAETAKLHENTFRAVNIALANELALMCDRLGISAWEVIEAASSKPFAFMPHYPGPGLGGDCIPIVPHYLAWRLREYGYSPQLIEAAHEINTRMPLHVIQKVSDALNDAGLPIKGSKVLLLGLAYKAEVSDTRESPSLEIMLQLLQRSAEISYCDPWVPSLELDGRRHESVEWSPENVAAADCLVVLTAHNQFVDQPLWDHARLIVDTRNAVPGHVGVPVTRI
ncbi:MAG: nucleotide sugar dehydrogenase [Actinobacteria bacterium]|nr:nucleotide sugar dehydrogenase [Actinomycetota bacterium]